MLKAKDIMTKKVVSVKPETTVDSLARLLIRHKISGAPVLDDKGRLEGIVTENDLISRNKRLNIPTFFTLFDSFIVMGSGRMEEEIKKMAAVTVDEICTKKVITITEESSIEEIATIMSEKKVHLLPVIENNKVSGIVGKADVIRGLAFGTPKQKRR